MRFFALSVSVLSSVLAISVLAFGQESRAAAQNAEPQLDAVESVFDGKTLSGWVTQGGRYDGNARWSIEDGVLVGRQGPNKAGGLIYHDRIYRSAIISFETKIDYPFDSGVFVRMTPPGGGRGAQVTLDYRPRGEVGAVYADGFLAHNTEAKKAFKKGEWNRVTVKFEGAALRLRAWLNGELITDYRHPKVDPSFAGRGLIGLQVHGGEQVPDEQSARFRKIRIRELLETDSELFQSGEKGLLSLTKKAETKGWKALFDGKTLVGWKPGGATAKSDYLVRDGEIVFPKEGGDGYLRTVKEDWRDFDLRLDFKISYMANSGLFLRADPKGGNPAFSGSEIQILDDFNWERVSKYRLADYQFTGGLYGAKAPAYRNAMRPLGAWNRYRILYRGSKLTTWLNGYQLYDVDTEKLASAKPPFKTRAARGFLGLQRHAPPQARGDYAWFRNIFIREL